MRDRLGLGNGHLMQIEPDSGFRSRAGHCASAPRLTKPCNFYLHIRDFPPPSPSSFSQLEMALMECQLRFQT